MNFQRTLRVLGAVSLMLLASLTLTGCLASKMYVDPTLPTITKADLPSNTHLHPVQVLFEFQTRGVSNATATSSVKPRVLAVANESGLFSGVSETTAANPADSGTLKIVINNTPLDEHPAAKGFGTGLTLGLAGSEVTDGYVCTADYTFAGKTTETVVRHKIYTTIGNHAAPPGLKPMKPMDAIHQVIDQLTWNAIKQLADNGAFK